MMPGGGENVHHWRHREITEVFSSLDATDAVAQADTFQQVARCWEEGLDAFDHAISVGLPAAWSGVGAEVAMSSIRRYLDQARELVAAVHAISVLVQAAADAVVATKYAIPEIVEESAVPVWSTDSGGMREAGIREEEARAAMRDRYIRPFGEIFSRIPLILRPIPLDATTGNGGPLGNDLPTPLPAHVVPGPEHYRPIGTDPAIDANVQRTCDESSGPAASSGHDVDRSAVTGAVPSSLADLPGTDTRRFDANLDGASGAATGIRIGAGGEGTAGALDVGAAKVDVMRVGESPGPNACGGPSSSSGQRGAGQANTEADSPGAAARNTFADRIALASMALTANDALAGNAVAANNAPTGNVLAADRAPAGNAPTAGDAGVETKASGAGQVAARWFHYVAPAPGVPDTEQEEHARGVPEYLITSANTEVLLGRPAPTITDGVIGGVRGDGHGSTVRRY